MNTITRNILEHIINKMLRKQNEWTNLFIQEINDNYHSIIDQRQLDRTYVMICDWYYFTVENYKSEFDFTVQFHIAKCAK